MTAVVGFAIVALAIAACLYVLIWHTEARPAAIKHWGEKYGVFYIPSRRVPGYSTWLWNKTRTLILWATITGGHFQSSAGTQVVISAFFAAVPLALWCRRLLPAFLLAAPIVTTLLFHLLGWWPWGGFRANQFLIIYILLLTLYSFELLGRCFRHRLVSIGVTAIAVVLIAAHFPTDFHAHDRKRIAGDSSLKRALEVIREHHLRHQAATAPRPQRMPLVAGRHAGPPIRYYTQQHKYLRDRFSFIRDEYEVIHVTGWGMSMWKDPRIPRGPMWVITENPDNTFSAKSYLKRNCDIEIMKDLPGHDLVALVRCPSR